MRFARLRQHLRACVVLALLHVAATQSDAAETQPAAPEVVRFDGAGVRLAGELFKPSGPGPFPAVLYNHGSAPGMLNSETSRQLGPLFASNGWVFFMPYRRGQGLSASAGPYIGDQIAGARRSGGMPQAAATMARLLATDHLDDQAAAFRWLQGREYVARDRIATAGNSFGGIEAILGAARLPYCAAVAASAASESWGAAPELQQALKTAVLQSNVPMFLFQAENDFSQAPNQMLVKEMQAAGKRVESKLYPRVGHSAREGHSFAYLGSATWYPDVRAFLERNCGR